MYITYINALGVEYTVLILRDFPFITLILINWCLTVTFNSTQNVANLQHMCIVLATHA